MRVAAAVLLLFVLCALPAQAQTGADVTITVVPPDGGAPKTVALSSLGAPDRPEGHSLAQVLRHAGVVDGQYDEVAVAQAGGEPVAIVSGEVSLTELRPVPSARARDPTASLSERTKMRAFPRANPVFLRSEATGVTLVRPSYFGKPAMTLSPVDGTLTLTVTAQAKIEATPSDPRTGQPVSFVATPPPGTDRAAVTYRWDFGDGSGETGGAEVTHTYASVKTRTVTVTFLVNGAPLDETAVVNVFVADPLRSGSAGDRRAGDARSRGPRGRGARDPPGEGGGGGGANAGGDPGYEDPGSYAPPPVDTYAPAPAAATPPPAAVPEPAPEPAPRRAEPQPSRAEQPRAEPEPAGETVSGYLLASAAGGPGGGGPGGDAGELPADAPEQLKQLAEPNEAATSGRKLPTIVWVGGGLLALLLLGWALEGRRTLPYWQP